MWRISVDTLARSRFVVSPLAETLACVKTLERGTAAHPGERAWLDAHLPAYRARLAAEPVTALVIKSALGRRWNADYLMPTPPGMGDLTFQEELERVRETPPEAVRAHLLMALERPLPVPLRRRHDLAERTADLLEWVWTVTVLPDWPRRRRVFEADAVARAVRLGRGGWADVLDDLRPGTRWLGDGRLRINVHDYPPRDISGAQLFFVPVTARTGWVTWEEPDRYALIYPCAGPLAGTERPPVPEALGALLGPARAGVLVLLGSPMSTTQLVALTGQGLGSVGRHLKVLLDARLVLRRRSGRSVLYYRTAAGDALVEAQEGEPSGARDAFR
ncbi:ArsR/SmtB family transcription factor [Actinomadura viridis]|uniref:DNA-binding transcriptional ArsR family regulator n=1 Tax=Actinomadura viridis TaxID=58110 RepID=A0A931GSF9_9ACTN|nr:ArsR family transcriptional regulator [Actinomadura viridis]MBG6093891.1 DNA-binding transcriptional ArsR family regulator [Actinomadura viridis]